MPLVKDLVRQQLQGAGSTPALAERTAATGILR